MKRGYTFIEVLIASLIFVLVMAAGTSSFLATVRTASKTRVTRETVEQARFAMETIVREARLATRYETSAAKDSLFLTTGNNQPVSFLRSPTGGLTVIRAGGSQPLIDEQIVEVTQLRFDTRCEIVSDPTRCPSGQSTIRIQPHVIVTLTVRPGLQRRVAGRPETENSYTLKTSVSLRNFAKIY